MSVLRLHPKLEAARRRLLAGVSDSDPLARPFLAAAAYSLIPAGRGQGEGVPTVAVDAHWRVYWNDAWVDACTVAELTAVLYHEIHHLLARHHARLRAWPQAVANWAADLEVNSRLIEEGFSLPAGGLIPDRLGLPRGLLAEEYARLLEQTKQDPAGSGDQGQDNASGEPGGATGSHGAESSAPPMSGPGEAESEAQPGGRGGAEGQKGKPPAPSCRASAAPSPGGAAGQDPGRPKGDPRTQQDPADPQHSDGQTPANGSQASGSPGPWELPSPGSEGGDTVPGLTEAEADLVARQVAQAIREHIRSRGTVPGIWARWAEKLLAPPKVPWQRIFAATIRRILASRSEADDATWARPSRRQGEVRPGEPIQHGQHAMDPDVFIIVDTSGSISDRDLATALTEVDHLLRRHLEEVRVTWWDAGHQGTQRLRRVREARPRGGGGTDMAAAIRHAEQSRPRPDLVVVVTDGFTPWPDHRPQIPIVIVLLDSSTRAQCPSWARVVEVSA